MWHYFPLIFLCLLPNSTFAQNKNFNKKLANYIENLSEEFDQISVDSKANLNELSEILIDKQRNGNPANLTFVSRYNAERTQLCQIWLDAAAKYYQIERINTFSSGFVPKEFSPQVAEALRRAGFMVEKLNGTENANYQTKVSKKSSSILSFSKHYSHPLNPKKDYAAIFVQKQTPEEIEMLSIGANQLIHLDYLKPYSFKEKKFETREYDAICQTIGREMLYVIYNVRQGLEGY